jgi:hypothetical protein
MPEFIQRLFITPPIAIARLGGSTTPQSSYRWVQAPDPHSTGETTIEPDWTLELRPDGSVEPVLPDSLQFRDGGLIRPVCPFLELWASIGEKGTAPEEWKDVPVTPDLLEKHGASLKDIAITIDAKNFKASRRTGNPQLQFGTFPKLKVTAEKFAPTPILAGSPQNVPADKRMIPPGKNIPLGFFQIIRSRPQPKPDVNHPWTQLENGVPRVNVEVIRFRFTPARGHFYGPPIAAKLHRSDENGGLFAPVDPTRAFLNGKAGWKNALADAISPDEPNDTYDGADIRIDRSNPSLGVVDDTCEARVEVNLQLPHSNLVAAANIFVSPPDFAPDRRPFLSLADELNDRSIDGAKRNAAMSKSDVDEWVQDLFERVYETICLLNLDLQRSNKAVVLTDKQLAATPIRGDATSEPLHAMSGRDKLRNRSFPLPPISNDVPLPLTQHARNRHRMLSDLDGLRDFIAQYPNRLEKLVRLPFEAEDGETTDGIGMTTMRMPPFMRNSNGGPLTLTVWQYELLMQWVDRMLKKAPRKPKRTISDGAARRRDEVLARLSRIAEKSESGDAS